MTAVVIRCPNCGTTQATLGECEACHHDTVGYFCPNHSPGRWLDGPACGACGARFGAAPESAPGPSRPAGATPPTSARGVEWRPPPSAPPPEMEVWPIELPRAPRAPRAPWPPRDPRDPREVPGAFEEEVWVPVDPAEGARVVARGAIGCVGRLVMTVIILVVLAVLLLGGLLGGALGFDAPRDPGDRWTMPGATAPEIPRGPPD